MNAEVRSRGKFSRVFDTFSIKGDRTPFLDKSIRTFAWVTL